MRWILLVSLFFANIFGEELLTPPPVKLPVEIYTGFFLLQLTDINEKNETFLADAYFSFEWNDPRLVHQDTIPKVFQDSGARDKLMTIWNPQIEFTNAYEPKINHYTLLIYSNGDVELHMAVTSHFFSALNFENFPFDRQDLRIHVDSFSWNKNIVAFVPYTDPVHFYNPDTVHLSDQRLIGISEKEETVIAGPILRHFETSHEFSNYSVSIIVERDSSYFLYQVFIPLLLIVGMSFSVFFGLECPYLDKVMINMSAFLVLIAVKFTINLNLPEIGYMTIIDKSFLVAYLCIAATIVVDALENVWIKRHKRRVKILNRYARAVIFVIFVTSILMIYLLNK